MFKLNYLRFLILFSFVISVKTELKFNNLNEQLVLQLIKVQPNKNLVASSLMVRFPLCKLAAIATGEAKEELMTVLGYKDERKISSCFKDLEDVIKQMSRADLMYLNKIFINYTDDIAPAFIANSTSQYGLQVEKIGFDYPKAALQFINRKVSTSTLRRITDILNVNDIDKNTSMIIINAAHFKGTWEFPFDFRLTKLAKFHHIDRKLSQVPMMTKMDDFSYYDTGAFKFLTIHFGSPGEGINFIVPSTDKGLPKLLNIMEKDPNFIKNNMKKMQYTQLQVFIPRFKIKTYVDWTGFLQELGLYKIFDEEDSGLERILKPNSKTKSIHVNKVKQKSFIQIDEMGIARFDHKDSHELMNREPASHQSVKQFVADVPFYFQVTLNYDPFPAHSRELFSGVYYGPEPEDVA